MNPELSPNKFFSRDHNYNYNIYKHYLHNDFNVLADDPVEFDPCPLGLTIECLPLFTESFDHVELFDNWLYKYHLYLSNEAQFLSLIERFDFENDKMCAYMYRKYISFQHITPHVKESIGPSYSLIASRILRNRNLNVIKTVFYWTKLFYPPFSVPAEYWDHIAKCLMLCYYRGKCIAEQIEFFDILELLIDRGFPFTLEMRRNLVEVNHQISLYSLIQKEQLLNVFYKTVNMGWNNALDIFHIADPVVVGNAKIFCRDILRLQSCNHLPSLIDQACEVINVLPLYYRGFQEYHIVYLFYARLLQSSSHLIPNSLKRQLCDVFLSIKLSMVFANFDYFESFFDELFKSMSKMDLLSVLDAVTFLKMLKYIALNADDISRCLYECILASYFKAYVGAFGDGDDTFRRWWSAMGLKLLLNLDEIVQDPLSEDSSEHEL